MKVLIISGSFYGMRCGVGAYTHLLARSLGDIGSMDIFVLTSKEASTVNDSKFQLFSTIDGWGFSSYRKILNLIKRSQPQIVHIQYPTIKYNKPYSLAIGFLPAAIRLFFPKIQIIVSIHDFSIGSTLSRIKQLPLLAVSDRVIISNERDRNGMLELFPYLRHKIRKIYIGSNIEFKKLDETTKLELKKRLCPHGERLLVYFGFLTKGKRIGLLLNAFKKFKKNIPCRLLILGRPQIQKDSNLVNNLKTLAKRLGIEGNITWAEGAGDEEVSRYLQCADMCVLPFERGADLRRTTLVTCIVHELPIVTIVNRKYLMDKELEVMDVARLVDMDKDDLAYIIEALLKDAKTRESMVRSMRQVKKRFSWEVIANDHLLVYEELISEHLLS